MRNRNAPSCLYVAGRIPADIGGSGSEDHLGSGRQGERDQAGGAASFWTVSVPAAQPREQQGHCRHGNHTRDDYAAQTGKHNECVSGVSVSFF